MSAFNKAMGFGNKRAGTKTWAVVVINEKGQKKNFRVSASTWEEAEKKASAQIKSIDPNYSVDSIDEV